MLNVIVLYRVQSVTAVLPDVDFIMLNHVHGARS